MGKLMMAGALGALIALAGCGGSKSSSGSSAPATSPAPASSTPAPATGSAASSGGGHSLKVAADPSGSLHYTTTKLTAKAGNVSIAFTNSSPVSHNLTIQGGSGGSTVGATPTFTGGTKTLKVKLKPGTYTFYCSVPGHRQAGMQGTLVVK